MASTNEIFILETLESSETCDDRVFASKESSKKSNTKMKKFRNTIQIKTTIAICLLAIVIIEISVIHWRLSTGCQSKQLAKKESHKNHTGEGCLSTGCQSKQLPKKESHKNHTGEGCPSGIQRQPNISTKFQETVILRELSTLSLTCAATGLPEPVIRWEYNCRDDGARCKFASKGHLQITNISEEDNGVIKCFAENSLGKDTQETTLVVHTKPQIILPKITAKPVVGLLFEIYCNALRNPLPKLSWQRAAGAVNGIQELSSDGRSLRLAIKHPLANDSGNYFCTAENYIGKENKSITINFMDVSQDCSQYRKSGYTKNSIYLINPDGGGTPFNAYCDMTTSNGGWTVIQRRQDGSVDFFKTWKEYKNGFGNLAGEFWLGNVKIHKLTKRQDMMIRFDLEDVSGVKAYAEYANFYIDDESKQYMLHVAGYSGTAGDSFLRHNGYRFSTKDRDHDTSSVDCANDYKGAWWYSFCHGSNLNGRYLNGTHSSYADGINWYKFRGHYNSLRQTEMKIRPRSCTM